MLIQTSSFSGRKSFLNLLLLVVLADAAVQWSQALSTNRDQVDPRIVGGTVAKADQFPYMVSLKMNSVPTCAGVLIAPNAVLTTAACINKSVPIESWAAWIGSSSIDSNVIDNARQIISIKNITLHKDYTMGTDNVPRKNIALCQLIRDFVAGPTAAIIPIGSTDGLKALQPANISGWGWTASGSSTPSMNLLYANIPIQTDTVCSNAYGTAYYEAGNMCCAGPMGGGKDACTGDGGAPLVTVINGTQRVVGLASWGAGCAVANYPGVYTKFNPSFQSWIQTTLNEWAIAATTTTASPTTTTSTSTTTSTTTTTTPTTTTSTTTPTTTTATTTTPTTTTSTTTPTTTTSTTTPTTTTSTTTPTTTTATTTTTPTTTTTTTTPTTTTTTTTPTTTSTTTTTSPNTTTTTTASTTTTTIPTTASTKVTSTSTTTRNPAAGSAPVGTCTAEGFSADLNDPKKYYRCVNGNLYSFNCPAGTDLWCQSLTSCVKYYQVYQCDD